MSIWKDYKRVEYSGIMSKQDKEGRRYEPE